MPLACVWHKERFYTTGPVPQNSAGVLADGKPLVSMPLSQNRFAVPTCITFLAFGIPTNVPLALLTMILLKQLARTRTDINLWPSELLQDWVMLFVPN